MSNRRRLPYNRLPARFRAQLDAFLPPDAVCLLERGELDVAEAVDLLRHSYDEAERILDAQGGGALARWMEAAGQTRKRGVYSTRLIKGSGGTIIVWHVGPADERKVDISDGGPLHVPEEASPAPERWRPHINWQMGQFFFAHEVIGADLPRVSSSADPPLLFLDGVPDEEDPVEYAVRLATELTAPGTEGREKYRLGKYVEGGPNIPDPLALKVAAALGVGKSRAREVLQKGGFKLPADLTWVRKPKPPRQGA